MAPEVVLLVIPPDGLAAEELVVVGLVVAAEAVVVGVAAILLQLDGRLPPFLVHNQDLLRRRHLVLPPPLRQLPLQPPLPQTTVRINTISTTPNSSRSNSSSTRLRGLPGNNSSSSRKRVNNYSWVR